MQYKKLIKTLFKAENSYITRYKKNKEFFSKLENNNTVIRKNNNQKIILVCVHSIDWGGAEQFAIEYIKYLYAKEITFHLFIEKATDNIQGFLNFISSDKLTFAENYQNSQEQLLNLISQINPTLIHIHHSFSAYKALPIIPRNVFIIDTLHIIEYQTGGYPYLAAENHKYIQLHHVISKGLYSYLKHELGIQKYKLKLGYLTDKSSKLLTKQRQFNANQIVIGYMGRFEKQKRPELFIECAKYLINALPNNTINFIMKGEGSLKENCSLLISKYKLLDKITLLPADNNLDTFHENIDILLNVAENEGLALIGLESARKHTLFISTDVGQQSEITSQLCLVSANPNVLNQEVGAIINNLVSIPQLFNEVLLDQQTKWEQCHTNSACKEILEYLYD